MSWEKILKENMAKDPTEYAKEILREIVFERMLLNQKENEIYESDYPFDFSNYELDIENIITQIYEVIDDFYENEYGRD